MLTYSLENRGSDSLYGYLYQCIKRDIETGSISSDEKLPSKRALAKHLGISLITVEGAYTQLVAEGYVRAEPRKGYFANPLMRSPLLERFPSSARASMRRTRSFVPCAAEAPLACSMGCDSSGFAKIAGNETEAGSTCTEIPNASQGAPSLVADLSNGSVPMRMFPRVIWAKTLRDVLAQEPDEDILRESPSMGSLRLRKALCGHLRAFRGLEAEPDQIVVGSGAQTLYHFIVQLLGRGNRFAVEEPGYPRLASIYASNDVPLSYVPLDGQGIDVAALRASHADVVHLMPSHQYPTGLVTSISRRYELLGWATDRPGRYIVEDDYDCEFRLAGRPIPTMRSIDAGERVIYANTFSRSLGPAFRIAYLVLPPHLAERFNRDLGFYSCTVSTLEQLALARFIENGNFERHVNRMRSHCRLVRNELVDALEASSLGSRMAIEGADAGLHFLLRIDSLASEAALVAAARGEGVALTPLSAFYRASFTEAEDRATSACRFLVSYAGLDRSAIAPAVDALARAVDACLHPVQSAEGQKP